MKVITPILLTSGSAVIGVLRTAMVRIMPSVTSTCKPSRESQSREKETSKCALSRKELTFLLRSNSSLGPSTILTSAGMTTEVTMSSRKNSSWISNRSSFTSLWRGPRSCLVVRMAVIHHVHQEFERSFSHPRTE